jgi:hypothetical protein
MYQEKGQQRAEWLSDCAGPCHTRCSANGKPRPLSCRGGCRLQQQQQQQPWRQHDKLAAGVSATQQKLRGQEHAVWTILHHPCVGASASLGCLLLLLLLLLLHLLVYVMSSSNSSSCQRLIDGSAKAAVRQQQQFLCN